MAKEEFLFKSCSCSGKAKKSAPSNMFIGTYNFKFNEKTNPIATHKDVLFANLEKLADCLEMNSLKVTIGKWRLIIK